MSIKQKLSLIKAALYFNEVLREKKISAAAQKNGIKQTNLSKLISEFEQAVNIPLLRRDNTGITPTNYGLKISETIKELEQKITELEKYILHFPNKTISYYFSPGITLNSLDLFQQEPLSPASRCAIVNTDFSTGLELRIHLPAHAGQHLSKTMDNLSNG